MRNALLSLLLCGAAVVVTGTEVSAATKHRRVRVAHVDAGAMPLTVNRRSWLDPGPAAPVGKGPSYIAATTQFSRDPEQVINPDRFGNDVLRGQPYVPGRTVPVLEFSTLPSGDVRLDNTIGYQNFAYNPATPDLPRMPATIPLFQQDQ